MRIGLDIDDTICNTNEVLMKYAAKYNSEHGNKPLLNPNTNNFSLVYGWSEEETYNFFRAYYLEALKEIIPKPDVKEILTKLKEEGNEIDFITARKDIECGGAGEAYRITKEWLDKYEIPYDNLYLNVKNKAIFCIEHEIDIFMDDAEKNVKIVKYTGIKTYMAMNNFNMNFKDEDITNIYSMNEFYEKVHDLIQ